jgi:hypothetical protein
VEDQSAAVAKLGWAARPVSAGRVAEPEQIQVLLSRGGPGRGNVGVDGIGSGRGEGADPVRSRDDARRQQHDCL